MTFRKEYREVESDAKWAFWRLFRWAIAVSIVCAGIGWASGMFSEVASPQAVIYNYEWFHSKSQAFESYKRQRDEMERAATAFREDAGPRANWSRSERDEWSQMQSHLSGLRQHCRDIAAEYNARSGMANRAIFKSGDLPDSLPIE